MPVQLTLRRCFRCGFMKTPDAIHQSRYNKSNMADAADKFTSSKLYDLAIIGSGPAGYTAAIYAARSQLSVVLIAGDTWGGQLMLTSEVENFPGFRDGILGPDLMAQMREQAERFGTEFITELVERIEFEQTPFALRLADESIVQARTVLIATGSQSKWLGLDSEQRLMARGVTSCATCDGYFFRDKSVAVVGGGDTAMEEALELTKYAAEITIIHRRDAFRASKIMQQRVLNHPKIRVIWNHEVVEVLGDKMVDGLKLRDTNTAAEQTVKTDGLFVAIGHKSATEFLGGAVKLNPAGYVEAIDQVKTSIPGVFVAGDVADPRYRQAITAAGDGCRAALEIERYLAEQSAPAEQLQAQEQSA